MFAQDYMSKALVIAAPDDLVIDVRRTMQDQTIRHVCVVEGGRLVGIVSLNSLRDAAPSKATDLSIHEVHYLLSKMRIRDVMKKEVITCGPRDHVEDVARVMQVKRIGAVPVVDKGRLLGILTNDDMFRILMKILGMEGPGWRVTLDVERAREDALVDIVRTVKGLGKFVKSVLSVESPQPGRQTIILHLDSSDMKQVLAELKKQGFVVEAVDELK